MGVAAPGGPTAESWSGVRGLAALLESAGMPSEAQNTITISTTTAARPWALEHRGVGLTILDELGDALAVCVYAGSFSENFLGAFICSAICSIVKNSPMSTCCDR